MFKQLTCSYLPKPSGTNFLGRDEGETILLLLRRSLVTNIPWVIITAALVILPSFFAGLGLYLNIPLFADVPTDIKVISLFFWYIFTFGYFFVNFLNWFFNVHLVTTKRVVDMDFSGLLHRDVSEAAIRNIEDVTYTISGAARVIFNYGNVLIQTAGDQQELEFGAIPKPAQVHDIITDLVSNLKGPNA
ncbi:MAG: PH domain-containing protein [Patescibacteria group bacterium]